MSVSSRPKNAGGPPLPQPNILRPRQSAPMYFYIYDGALSEPKHANTLARIETRLTDLEIQGRVGRLGPLKSAKEMVTSALKAGASTIVAVGDDRTIAQAINAVAGSEATLGVIPVGSANRMATLLGLPEGEAACEVLAARKTELVDLGKANAYYFLTEATVEGEELTLKGDDSWTLTASTPSMQIINLDHGSHCQDGLLEATIEHTKKEGWFKKQRQRSVVPFEQGEISCRGEGLMTIEGSFTLNLPVMVEIIPRALKIIVGRDRAF